MRTIQITEPGGTEVMHYVTSYIPQPEELEVLIKVKAIAINPVDVKTRSGKGVYGRIKSESPIILGWDIAGMVEAVGNQVTKFKKGDAVFGMVKFPGHAKAYAEYLTAPESHLALKPSSISFAEAAATTLAALTAFQALVKRADIQSGQNVLIHAAAGGVGHFAVQIARHLGATVTGTSSAVNKDFVLSLGAHHHIDYQQYDWNHAGDTFDFILDTIGGENIDRSLLVAKPGGTLISIPTGLSEAVTEKAKAKSVNGYFMLVESNGADMEILAEWLAAGIIRPHISHYYSFEEMDQAHMQQETGRTVGKLVIQL